MRIILDRLLAMCGARWWQVLAAGIALLLVGAGGAWLWLGTRPAPLSTQIQTVLDRQDLALLQASARDGDDTRFLTVLIPYDRTRFFIDAGRPRGFEYDLVKQFEESANKRRRKGEPALQAIFVPTPFAGLVPLLASGTGDIAAGGLTITDSRRELVDFTAPYLQDVRELVVTHRAEGADPAAEPSSLEDLAGRSVMLAAGSSYIGHVQALSERLAAAGLGRIEIVEAPASMMSEDILEMVNAGIVETTVVDEHVAKLWAAVLDGIEVHDDLAVHEGGEIAWAVRKDLPKSRRRQIDAFLEEARKGTLLGNIIFKRYYENVDWIANPLEGSGLEALVRLRPHLEKAAAEHGFDWRLLAALAFQESQFNSKSRSKKGAVGLMQVLPSTAKELGFADVAKPAANIAAGAAYLAKLRDGFAAENGIDEQQALNFALAAYNAGPSRLAEIREVAAKKMRLDPDRWFLNVERAAQRVNGSETVRYVANINKYVLAYQLGEALLQARLADREAVR